MARWEAHEGCAASQMVASWRIQRLSSAFIGRRVFFSLVLICSQLGQTWKRKHGDLRNKQAAAVAVATFRSRAGLRAAPRAENDSLFMCWVHVWAFMRLFTLSRPSHLRQRAAPAASPPARPVSRRHRPAATCQPLEEITNPLHKTEGSAVLPQVLTTRGGGLRSREPSYNTPPRWRR